MKKIALLFLALVLGLTTQAQMVGATSRRDKTTKETRSTKLHTDSYQPGWLINFHATGLLSDEQSGGLGFGLGYRISPTLYAGLDADILIHPRDFWIIPCYADLKIFLPLKRCALFIDGEFGYAWGSTPDEHEDYYDGLCWGLYGGYNYRNFSFCIGIKSMMYHEYEKYYSYIYWADCWDEESSRKILFSLKLTYSIPLKSISNSLYHN